ncbi:MAG: hypothetical protein GY757_25750, partial [bacterium]|nr:hypothetical protein [bacterium]
FFCDERIAEYTGLSVDRLSGQQRDFHYVYNYQLIQDKNGIKETRKLFGGRKSSLQSKSVRNEKLVFGPIMLLHKEARTHYIYRFLSEETIKGEKVLVIDVIPHMLHEKNRLFGKVWLRASDCSILKIQWNPKYVDSFNRILMQAAKLNADPAVTTFTEYSVEKNGIRFPGKHIFEEGYIKKPYTDPGLVRKKTRKNKIVRTKVEIAYKKYRFFIVGTEIVEEEGVSSLDD